MKACICTVGLLMAALLLLSSLAMASPVAMYDIFKNYDAPQYQLTPPASGYVQNSESYAARTIAVLPYSEYRGGTPGTYMASEPGKHVVLYMSKIDFNQVWQDTLTMSDGSTHIITVTTTSLGIWPVDYGTNVSVDLDGTGNWWNVYLLTNASVYIDIFIPTDLEKYQMVGVVRDPQRTTKQVSQGVLDNATWGSYIVSHSITTNNPEADNIYWIFEFDQSDVDQGVGSTNNKQQDDQANSPWASLMNIKDKLEAMFWTFWNVITLLFGILLFFLGNPILIPALFIVVFLGIMACALVFCYMSGAPIFMAIIYIVMGCWLALRLLFWLMTAGIRLVYYFAQIVRSLWPL